MKRMSSLLSVFALFFIGQRLNAQAPPFAWAAQTINDADAEDASCIAVDKQNQVLYIAGSFEGNAVDFGSGQMANVDPSSGTTDIYLAKYTTNGQLVWAKSFGGEGDEVITGTAVDGTGKVYIGGYFDSDTLRFGNQVLTVPYGNSGDNAFLVKLDDGGNVLWAKNCIMDSVASIMPFGRSDVAVDQSDNVYFSSNITGGSAVFDGHPILSAPGWGGVMFTVKFDANGNYQWAATSGSLTTSLDPGNSFPNAITVDKDGNCVVVGNFTGDIEIGGTVILTSNDNYFDRFIAKINGSDGSFIWASGTGHWQGADQGVSVSTDGSGNIYESGIYVNPTEGPNSNAETDELFIEKYASNGDSSWFYHYPIYPPYGLLGLVCNQSGDIYLGITVYDTMAVFQGDTMYFPPTHAFGATVTTTQLAVLKLNNNGQLIWSKTTRGLGFVPSAIIGGIGIDNSGYVYLTGTVSDTCLFDNHTLVGSTDDNDVFVARIGGTVNGIADVERDNSSVFIYPNPAATEFHFHFSGKNENTDLRLYNMEGQLVAEAHTTSSSDFSWDIPQKLMHGSYLCHISYMNGSTFESVSKLLEVE